MVGLFDETYLFTARTQGTQVRSDIIVYSRSRFKEKNNSIINLATNFSFILHILLLTRSTFDVHINRQFSKDCVSCLGLTTPSVYSLSCNLCICSAIKYTNTFLFYSSSTQITISWYLVHVERTVKNGNSISGRDILENDRNDAVDYVLFNRIWSLFCTFITLQDKHNIHCKNRSKKLIEDFLSYSFLKLVQIKFIFSDNVHIWDIYNLLSFSFYFSSTISFIH